MMINWIIYLVSFVSGNRDPILVCQEFAFVDFNDLNFKGPSSALSGSEAIGGAVNIIPQGAPAFTTGEVSLQMNDKGYKRTDAQFGTSFGKWGIVASGYYADKSNDPIVFGDFSKKAFSLLSDYRPNDKTS